MNRETWIDGVLLLVTLVVGSAVLGACAAIAYRVFMALT